jgi:hypothetical protein
VPNASPTCSSGTCGYTCKSGYSLCTGGACVNEQTDPNNCGTCGHTCTTTIVNAQPTCAAGSCSYQCINGTSACSGACANLQTDPNNCNRCGHGCCGGQCTAGACQPLTLVSGITGVPEYLSVANGQVYFDENASGAVKSVPVGGGTVTTLATGQAAPMGLATSSSSVYWVGTNNSTNPPSAYMSRVALAGDTVQQVVPSLSGLIGIEVAVSGNTVPWTSASPSGFATVNTGVNEVDVSSANPPWPDTFMAPAPTALGIAVAGGQIYFSVQPGLKTGPPPPPLDGGPSGSSSGFPSSSGSTGSSGVGSSGIGSSGVGSSGIGSTSGSSSGTGSSSGASCTGCASIQEVPLAGGNVITVVSGLNDPAMLATDTHSVYWADPQSGTVMSTPLVGSDGGGGSGIINLIASGQSEPLPVKVDATYVYWGNNTGGQLVAAPIGGGTAVTLATGQPNIRDLALTTSCIYWTTAQSNTVMAIGKP